MMIITTGYTLQYAKGKCVIVSGIVGLKNDWFELKLLQYNIHSSSNRKVIIFGIRET